MDIRGKLAAVATVNWKREDNATSSDNRVFLSLSREETLAPLGRPIGRCKVTTWRRPTPVDERLLASPSDAFEDVGTVTPRRTIDTSFEVTYS